MLVVMMRYTAEPIVLGGYEIPPNVPKPSLSLFCKGVLTLGQTTVQPWIGAAMTDPRIWPDAKAFVPERWLGEYKGVIADKKDFYSFSGGTRNCIGQQ
jgi:cytochrome P450